MRPSEDHDRVGLLPPGIGYKPAEPELPAVTMESVLADIARLSVEDRQAIRLKLNMAAYGMEPPRVVTIESVLADLLSLSEDDQSRVRLEAYRLVTASRPPPNRSEMEAIRARDNWELQNALGNKTVSMAQMMVDAGDRRMQAIAAGLYGKVAPGT